MTAYYNEYDPFAAKWLRNLIDAGLIAPGIVDERSITDVTPSDLKGFKQCHFFAGIGGWSYALRLAGIPDNFSCWTGSPPCQPFSTAGKQLGQLDERHLAPTFMRLVSQCRPPVLFGEQVAAAIGKHWLDDLFDELEREEYACAAAVLPAASVGAPHKRDRLFFGSVLLDHASSLGWNSGRHRNYEGNDGEQPCAIGKDGGLAKSLRSERDGQRLSGLGKSHLESECRPSAKFAGCSDSDCVANSHSERFQGEWFDCNSKGWERSDFLKAGLCIRAGDDFKRCCSNKSYWAGADWLGCKDGKFRPVESGTFPLVNGIPKGVGRGKSSPYTLASNNRKGRLKGYGNAIVPQVAAEFIKSFLESIPEVNLINSGRVS
ncbi:DNA cytosine methyltransferase [Enterobacter hormaechei]